MLTVGGREVVFSPSPPPLRPFNPADAFHVSAPLLQETPRITDNGDIGAHTFTDQVQLSTITPVTQEQRDLESMTNDVVCDVTSRSIETTSAARCHHDANPDFDNALALETDSRYDRDAKSANETQPDVLQAKNDMEGQQVPVGRRLQDKSENALSPSTVITLLQNEVESQVFCMSTTGTSKRSNNTSSKKVLHTEKDTMTTTSRKAKVSGIDPEILEKRDGNHAVVQGDTAQKKDVSGCDERDARTSKERDGDDHTVDNATHAKQTNVSKNTLIKSSTVTFEEENSLPNVVQQTKATELSKSREKPLDHNAPARPTTSTVTKDSGSSTRQGAEAAANTFVPESLQVLYENDKCLDDERPVIFLGGDDDDDDLYVDELPTANVFPESSGIGSPKRSATANRISFALSLSRESQAPSRIPTLTIPPSRTGNTLIPFVSDHEVTDRAKKSTKDQISSAPPPSPTNGREDDARFGIFSSDEEGGDAGFQIVGERRTTAFKRSSDADISDDRKRQKASILQAVKTSSAKDSSKVKTHKQPSPVQSKRLSSESLLNKEEPENKSRLKHKKLLGSRRPRASVLEHASVDPTLSTDDFGFSQIRGIVKPIAPLTVSRHDSTSYQRKQMEPENPLMSSTSEHKSSHAPAGSSTGDLVDARVEDLSMKSNSQPKDVDQRDKQLRASGHDDEGDLEGFISDADEGSEVASDTLEYPFKTKRGKSNASRKSANFTKTVGAGMQDACELLPFRQATSGRNLSKKTRKLDLSSSLPLSGQEATNSISTTSTLRKKSTIKPARKTSNGLQFADPESREEEKLGKEDDYALPGGRTNGIKKTQRRRGSLKAVPPASISTENTGHSTRPRARPAANSDKPVKRKQHEDWHLFNEISVSGEEDLEAVESLSSINNGRKSDEGLKNKTPSSVLREIRQVSATFDAIEAYSLEVERA